MSESNWIQQVVGRIVAQVLETHVPTLRDDLVRRVLQEIPQGATPAGEVSTPKLLRVMQSIHAATAQRDVLAALLDGASQFCERAALFVIRSGNAVGWQSRGLGDAQSIKNITLAASSPLVARALDEKKPIQGPTSQFDSQFVASFGAPADLNILLLPLILRDKVAAILYADSGAYQGGRFDASALELMALSCGLWLEVTSFRRTANAAAAHGAGEAHAEADLHADHHGEEAPAATAQAEQPVPIAMAAAAGAGMETVATVASVAAAVSVPSAGSPAVSAADEEVHRKAKRFAKLLVDEIQLYNKEQVAEGRKHKDLYDRLKEDIEKSRGAYEKRYGQTAAASANYFDQEVVRILAENNRSLLGGNYPR